MSLIRPIGFRIRVVGHAERVETFELKEVRIGAIPGECDLCIMHDSISTELRARIRQQEGELVLTNYSSAAPMKVNGQGANARGVAHDDVLRIGEVEIVIVFEKKPDPREQALIDDIVNDPSDDTVREVYADWLEENGFADRAQYLRLDSAVNSTLKGDWPLKIREDVALLAGLTRNLPPAWLALMKRGSSSKAKK